MEPGSRWSSRRSTGRPSCAARRRRSAERRPRSTSRSRSSSPIDGGHPVPPTLFRGGAGAADIAIRVGRRGVPARGPGRQGRVTLAAAAADVRHHRVHRRRRRVSSQAAAARAAAAAQRPRPRRRRRRGHRRPRRSARAAPRPDRRRPPRGRRSDRRARRARRRWRGRAGFDARAAAQPLWSVPFREDSDCALRIIAAVGPIGFEPGVVVRHPVRRSRGAAPSTCGRRATSSSMPCTWRTPRASATPCGWRWREPGPPVVRRR